MPYEDDYKKWLEEMLIESNPDWVCDGMYDLEFTHEWCGEHCGEDSNYVTPKCLHLYYHHIARADRKTESISEKPNNCEHITEDGVTCARYPACDGCPDNPLNKVKGSERLVKGSEQTEPTISKMEQVDEPQTCDTCEWGERYRQGYDITMMDDECGGCCSWNSKWTPKDEPQMREATAEERQAVRDYIESISEKTGVMFYGKNEPQTEYKKWEMPKVDKPTEITTCVGVAMALIEDEPQTERNE